MNNEAIVNSIKNLCKNKSISASQLEKEIGLSQGLISKWQKTMPSLDKIIDIADYFSVSVDAVIGRRNDFDDKFLEIIYSKTIDKSMLWSSNSILNKDRIAIPHRDDYYDEEMYTEISYLSKFNQGAFIINCFCKYHKTINPIDLDFYIKPDIKSELVWQNYNLNQLKPLWIAIINNLVDGAPDEIKVENIKQQFLNGGSNIVEAKADTYYKRLKVYHDKLNTPEFQEFYKVITTEEYSDLLNDFKLNKIKPKEK